MVDPAGDTPPPSGKGKSKRVPKEELQAQIQATRADFERQVKATKAQFDETNQRIQARTGRNLILATLIGLGLGLVMLFSLVLVKQVFAVFGVILIGFTTFELVTALRDTGRRIDVIPAVISSVAIVAAGAFLDPGTRWAVLAGSIAFIVVWRLIAQMRETEHRGAGVVLRDLIAAILVQIYVPFLGSFAVVLVAQPEGQWWTLAFIILVISVDVGAYASGLSFGKHPMAPKISPKKTWEGFAGAAFASVVAGVLLAIFMLGAHWWVGVIFGLAILGTATMGDLTESLIKRDMGIKDMSSWLPGHGGFLDRLDSMLPSAPVALAIYMIFSGASLSG